MKILGSVDGLGRLLLRVDVPGRFYESVLFQIDTGVNRSLVINRESIKYLGPNNFDLDRKEIREVVLADHSKIEVWGGVARIIWFGKVQLINCLVTTTTPSKLPLESDPIGLIGTELLRDCRLTVNFPAKLVTLEELE